MCFWRSFIERPSPQSLPENNPSTNLIASLHLFKPPSLSLSLFLFLLHIFCPRVCFFLKHFLVSHSAPTTFYPHHVLTGKDFICFFPFSFFFCSSFYARTHTRQNISFPFLFSFFYLQAMNASSCFVCCRKKNMDDVFG